MKREILKANETGFCFGVRRAIDILEKEARTSGKLETLGAVVHNDQVLKRLQDLGISVIKDINENKTGVVAISSHGVPPETETMLSKSPIRVIDTTCPFVRRAQISARRLNEAGFFVVVFGEAQHPEVKGILGHAKGYGIAITDAERFSELEPKPRRIGILSQTTQIPESYTEFVKHIIDQSLLKDAEIRILDTICHDIRQRQRVSIDLAKHVDLMLVIGGHASANTKRLTELCSTLTETRQIETADDIKTDWIVNKKSIGITSGTSTSDQTIDMVIDALKIFEQSQK